MADQKNGELTLSQDSLKVQQIEEQAEDQIHENGNGHSNEGLGIEIGKEEAAFHPGWYADFFTDGPGKAQLYKMEKQLFHGKSEFQDLFVFESSDHGKVAILDGFLQLTERDEFAYQEMISHLPLCSIPDPKKVLLVGGGDGGILREISRHSSVEQIDLCEIDTMIIDVYQRFFPKVAIGYKDSRVKVHIGDGVSFMKCVPQGTYDAIILDAFPNMGAGELADNKFLESAARALRPGGVLSAPADSFWHKNFNKFGDTMANCREIFKGSVNYAWTTVPAYASGAIGFLLCATEGPVVDFRQPVNPLSSNYHGVSKGPTKFYNSAMHSSAFRLPAFAERIIGVSSSSCSPN